MISWRPLDPKKEKTLLLYTIRACLVPWTLGSTSWFFHRRETIDSKPSLIGIARRHQVRHFLLEWIKWFSQWPHLNELNHTTLFCIILNYCLLIWISINNSSKAIIIIYNNNNHTSSTTEYKTKTTKQYGGQFFLSSVIKKSFRTATYGSRTPHE